MNTNPPRVDDQQALCRSCGICCQGLLFEYAEFDPGERHQDWPDDMIASSSENSFPLPCRAYQASGCSVYSTRPAVCCDYQCALLKRFAGGAVTLADAQFVIQQTKAIADDFYDALAEVMPVDRNQALSTLFEAFRKACGNGLEDREFHRKYKRVQLSYAKLVFELTAHFREKETG